MTPEYRKRLIGNLVEAIPIIFILFVVGLVMRAQIERIHVDGDQRVVKHVDGPSDLYKACPPGHLVEFQLPSTRLYLDLRWLGSMAIIHLFYARGTACPTDAVTLSPIDFNGSIPHLLGIDNGLKIFRMNVGGAVPASWLPPPPKAEPFLPSSSDRPWVENVTARPPHNVVFGPPKPDSGARAYELHFPATPDQPAHVSMVVCASVGKDPSNRYCHNDQNHTPYGSLYASYILIQPKLPVPDREEAVSSDAAMEPGALLDFDMRFREWILERQRKP